MKLEDRGHREKYDVLPYNYLDAVVVFCQQIIYVLFYSACFIVKGIEIQIDSKAKTAVELYENYRR